LTIDNIPDHQSKFDKKLVQFICYITWVRDWWGVWTFSS